MQYLLTEDEYKALAAAGPAATEAARATINQLCTQVAENLPVVVSWSRDKTPRPWGCRHSKIEGRKIEYCDECPVRKTCTQPKNFSK